MEREAFTFYASFWKTAQKIKDDAERLAFYDAIAKYGCTHEESDLSDYNVADPCFEQARPNLDSGWDKAIAGKKGGEKQNEKCLSGDEKQTAECLPQKTKQNEKCLSQKSKQNEKCLSGDEKHQDHDQDYNQDQDDIIVSCPESSSEPPVIALPLNDGTEYPVTESDVDGWNASYPAVDVMQQLRNMREWLLSNPTRRKTKTGIRRFVTTWLAREQDRGGTRGQPAARSGTTERQGITRNDDIDALVRNKVLEGL